MKRLWPVVLILLLPGCRDHPEPVTPVQPRPPSVAEQRQAEVGVWCDMIEQAALSEYANLGRRMHAQGRVRFVRPPALDAEFNAFADVRAGEVWINEPMWSRYPDRLDRATILLHELIHLHSGELSHYGPWWADQERFRQYWACMEG